MVLLVLGSNGSGKSVYAEKLAVKLSKGDLYYIATMIPYGEEGQARIERHKKQREALGFITMEKPFNVSDIAVSPGAAILLEDVSNLLSNALFDDECKNDPSGRRTLHPFSEDRIFSDITTLCGKCHASVLVSIDGLMAKPEYNDETRKYIDSLNRLNNRLCHFAEIVISMCHGKPTFIKGGGYDLA